MSIRRSNKDHLPEMAPELTLVRAPKLDDPAEPLIFWTRHERKPYLVDLLFLRDGLSQPKKGNSKRWAGAFSGRPELVLQLLPAIKERLLYATEDTCRGFLAGMRSWWRLFDVLEAPHPESGTSLVRLTDVKQLTDLHGQAARDAGFDTHTFTYLRSVASATRQALGLKPLHWIAPEPRSGKRRLPSDDCIRKIWITLKHGWFATLARWNSTRALMNGTIEPANSEEATLLLNYRHFETARARVEKLERRTHPTLADLRTSDSPGARTPPGTTLSKMYAGFYPNGEDARFGFHLCLVGSGWNPQTMLDLEVDVSKDVAHCMPFLKDHPSDASRYVLDGFKERGKSEQTQYGEWKTDRSPGAVIKELVTRTWPLRMEVVRQLRLAETALSQAIRSGSRPAEINNLQKKTNELTRSSKSVWIYLDAKGIQTLKTNTYRITGRHPRKEFLKIVIDRINSTSMNSPSVPYIVATDFRDAFAAHVWRSTGGSILHVMQALGHRSARTATIYLNNTAINAESARVFRTFSNVVWKRFEANEAIDHTLIAKLTRDGEATPVELARLEGYRALKRSRIGVACRNPHDPPMEIDPDFVADGKAQCTIQRCTLCFANAVITPESMPGLAMRLAELRWHKTNMPVLSFSAGDFQREMEMTEAALLGFDPEHVESEVGAWEDRISTGKHRVIEFRGRNRHSAG